MNYSIGLIVDVNRDKGPDSGFYSPFPRTKEKLEEKVKELSVLVRKYGEKILKGDNPDFVRIEQKEADHNR